MAVDSIIANVSARVAGAIRDAARSTGTSFEYLLTAARIESSLNPAAQATSSSAAGLYASTFYIGGSAGAFLVGFVWNAAGWTGCVAAIVAVQAIMAAIVALAWEGSRS